MNLKLECTLRLKTESKPIDIAIDVNSVTLPDDMSDEAVTAFFNKLRDSMKAKYIQTVLNLLEVDIKEITG